MSTDLGWPFNLQWPTMPTANFAPNPGWTFGNVIVNSQNSSAPEVEQAVVSKVSYGRQIGRLTEAVEALVAALPKAAADPRVKGFLELAAQVEAAKAEATESRLARLRRELEELKESDEAEWRKLVSPRR